MRDGYVTGADPTCLGDRCQTGRALLLLEAARNIMEQNGRQHMSAALWCDQGGHAFSERDPGRQRISVSTLDDNENENMIAKDFCGECAARAGLTQPRKTRPTLLPGSVDG